MNTLRGADFNAYINIIENKNHFHSPKLEKNQKKPIPPPRLLLSTLQRAVKKQQFRAKPLPSPFCRARLARFTTCRTLKSPSLSKYRTFSPVEQGEFSLSLSLSLWVETVYDSGGVRAFRHLFAKRAQRSGGIRDSQQPSGNKEAVGDELYPKNRGALRASARYSCFLGNAAVIPVLPLAYFPPPVENGEPSFNTM